MKRKLERFMGTGPEQGVAARFTVQSEGGLEIVVVAPDAEALQLYISVLGLDPLTADQMEEVMVVEKRHVQGIQAIDTPTKAPGSGLIH